MLTEINTPTGSVMLGDQEVKLRGLNLEDVSFIQQEHPQVFENLASAIEQSDGSETDAIGQLVTSFNELAVLAVAVAADARDQLDVVRKWPLGSFISAVMEVYRLTTLGNEAAKKSIKEMLPEGMKGIAETH